MRYTNAAIRTIIFSSLVIILVASPVSGCAEMYTWTLTSRTNFDTNMKVVMAGDNIYATNGEEMMQYNNDEWNKIDTDIHPDLRRYFSITYDETNEQIMLFGGTDDDSGSIFNDLWSFDTGNKKWSELTGYNEPLGVQDGYIVDLPDMNKFVLFSGTNGLGAQNYFELFDYSTSTWEHISPDSYIPTPRWGHSIVYIESTGLLYIIGGCSWGVSDWEYRNDVHAYNFTSNEWTMLIDNGDAEIQPRARFATEYDPIHNAILVQGGMSDNGTYGDTWSYDISNNEWNELQLEDEVVATGHSIVLKDNIFHLVYSRHYILDDLSLDALYTRNDNRADQLSDYDREECLKSNYFSDLINFGDFDSIGTIISIIAVPIVFVISVLIKFIKRIKAKERPTYEYEDNGFDKF